MALSNGTSAPNFTLPSTNGRDITLSTDAAGQPLILYFYPKDFTTVCTAEACGFRDSFEDFTDVGVTVYGISRDDISTHLRFKKEQNLPFELLADTEGQVAKLYKAIIPLVGLTRRITYLLDSQHQIVASYENMFSAENHIRQMVEKVKQGGIKPDLSE